MIFSAPKKMFLLRHFFWSSFVPGTHFWRFYPWVRLIDWHIYLLHALICSTKSTGKIPLVGSFEV